MMDEAISQNHAEWLLRGGSNAVNAEQVFGCHNPSGITPLDLVALVLPDPIEEITKGGIYIPETVQAKEKYHTQKATLIAVGKSCFVQWIEKPKAGDRVLIVQYAGTLIKGKDGKEYRIIKEDDLIAELEE